MLAVNRLWVGQLNCDSIIANSYADNWAYASTSPQSHKLAIQGTLRVTRALKLQIDWKKTWAWGAQDNHVHALRAAADRFLPDGVALQKVPHARELGYIMHYRRRQFRGTQKLRHSQALRRLNKLGRQDLGLDTKALIAHQSCTVKAMFGVHIYVPAMKYFNELRTGISQAMIPGAYTNPHLATQILTKHSIDPELYVIQQAIKSSRRFLHWASRSDCSQFLSLASRPPPEPQSITGPAQALSHYIRRLGWQISKEGMLLLDGFISISLRDGDLTTILEASLQAWMQQMESKLTRQHWRKAGIIDARATAKLISGYDPHDQKLLAREILGSFQTQHQKTHFAENLSDECPLCGMEDSVEHRVLRCPALQKVREPFRSCLQHLEEFHPIRYQLPVLYEEPDFSFHRVLHHRQPELNWIHMDSITMATTPPTFFTDGSCRYPHLPNYRWASFSIIWLDPKLFDMTAQMLFALPPGSMDHFHVAAIGNCPGRQTIPRAELEAAIQITDKWPSATIVTDSAYVVAAFDRVAACINASELAREHGYDQLLRLFQIFQRGPQRPTLRKTKAHTEKHADMTWNQLLDWHGNYVADEVAKEASISLNAPWKDSLDKQAKERLRETKLLQEQWNLRLALCKQRTALISQQMKIEVSSSTSEQLRLELSTLVVDPVGFCFALGNFDLKIASASPWGFAFTSLVIQWLTTLRWPNPPPTSSSRAPIGVAWLELAMNFRFLTQRTIPVNVSSVKGQFDFRSEETHPSFTSTMTTMWRMADSFRRCLHFLSRMSKEPLLPMQHSRQVRSLYLQVGHGYAGGLSLRPQMVDQRDTLNILHMWLGKPDPAAHPNFPERNPLFSPLTEPHEFTRRDQQELYKELMRTKRKPRGHQWMAGTRTVRIWCSGCGLDRKEVE